MSSGPERIMLLSDLSELGGGDPDKSYTYLEYRYYSAAAHASAYGVSRHVRTDSRGGMQAAPPLVSLGSPLLGYTALFLLDIAFLANREIGLSFASEIIRLEKKESRIVRN